MTNYVPADVNRLNLNIIIVVQIYKIQSASWLWPYLVSHLILSVLKCFHGNTSYKLFTNQEVLFFHKKGTKNRKWAHLKKDLKRWWKLGQILSCQKLTFHIQRMCWSIILTETYVQVHIFMFILSILHLVDTSENDTKHPFFVYLKNVQLFSCRTDKTCPTVWNNVVPQQGLCAFKAPFWAGMFSLPSSW